VRKVPQKLSLPDVDAQRGPGDPRNPAISKR
jgi:hypothetical protein